MWPNPQTSPPSPGPPKSVFSFIFLRGLTIYRGPVFLSVFCFAWFCLVVVCFCLVLLGFGCFGILPCSHVVPLKAFNASLSLHRLHGNSISTAQNPETRAPPERIIQCCPPYKMKIIAKYSKSSKKLQNTRKNITKLWNAKTHLLRSRLIKLPICVCATYD